MQGGARSLATRRSEADTDRRVDDIAPPRLVAARVPHPGARCSASLLTGAHCYPAGHARRHLRAGDLHDLRRERHAGARSSRASASTRSSTRSSRRATTANALLDFSYAGGSRPQRRHVAPESLRVRPHRPHRRRQPRAARDDAARLSARSTRTRTSRSSATASAATSRSSRVRARPPAPTRRSSASTSSSRSTRRCRASTPTRSSIIDIVPCEKTYLAGGELVAQKLDPADAGAPRANRRRRWRSSGIRLATFGNAYDCLWNTGLLRPRRRGSTTAARSSCDDAAASKMYSIDSVAARQPRRHPRRSRRSARMSWRSSARRSSTTRVSCYEKSLARFSQHEIARLLPILRRRSLYCLTLRAAFRAQGAPSSPGRGNRR